MLDALPPGCCAVCGHPLPLKTAAELGKGGRPQKYHTGRCKMRMDKRLRLLARLQRWATAAAEQGNETAAHTFQRRAEEMATRAWVANPR